MAKIRLTLSCWEYDRTRALQEGKVQVEGVDLTYLPLHVEETFWRMLRYQEFDAAECSMSSYLMARERGYPRLIAIPVFPSRFFRHSFIFVNTESGIEAPKDLVGKRLGVPEYQITAAVWVRGILQHEYGVAPEKMKRITTGGQRSFPSCIPLCSARRCMRTIHGWLKAYARPLPNPRDCAKRHCTNILLLNTCLRGLLQT